MTIEDAAAQYRRVLPTPLYALLLLPVGLGRGFVTVTLSYLLKQSGVSVGAIGALVALYLAPEAWKFLSGPMMDVSLSPKRWYLLSLVVGILVLLGFAFVPLNPQTMGLVTPMALTLSCAFTCNGSAFTAVVAATVPESRRGAVAGWAQAGNLGGAGVGGGLGLWLATHAGGQASAVAGVAAICLLSLLPLLAIRTPNAQGGLSMSSRLVSLWLALVEIARSRNGILVIISVTIPMGLGASMGLLAALANDWKVSADVVALVLGAVSGVANLPGCVFGGYLCDRFPRRVVFISTAVASSAGLALLALGPHTPTAFVVLVVFNAVLLGAAWAAVAAVVYGELDGRAAATVGSALGALSNVPLVLATAFLGSVADKHGSNAMLLTEAGMGVAVGLAYALLAWLWRPDVQRAAAAA